MKELVIISGKGGTGKTSVTGGFAALTNNMILADADVDASDLHLLLKPNVLKTEDFSGGKVASIDPEKCTRCGRCQEVCRFDAITDVFHVDIVGCEGCGVCVWNCPADAITFNAHVNGECYISETRYGDMVHAGLGIAEENSGKLVTLVREKARELAQQKQRQLLLVDGPPGTGCPVIAAIGGADMLLVVAEPTLSAIHDMKRVLNVARHFGVKAGICINKYDLKPELACEIEQFCKTEKVKILGKIPFDENMVKAQVNGVNIIEYDDGNLKNAIIAMWEKIKSEIAQL